MMFVDANIFLRFFITENSPQHDGAVKLFQEAAEGKHKLFTSLIVFFEVYWVAVSFYGLQKSAIVQMLLDILKMEFVELSERSLLLSAILIYEETSFGLEDAYHLVFAKANKATAFKTFDTKLLKKATRML